MIPVSIIVMTRNESVNLPACLESVRRFREVFVVDSGSTDGTPEIAVALGAVVVPFSWDGGYPKKKQWCLDRLPFAGDWVMYLDADERLTPALEEEIAALMRVGPHKSGYFVTGVPVFLGRRLRFGVANRKLILLNRHHACFPVVPDLDVATMWEVEGHYQPVVDGAIGKLRQALLHEDRKPPSAWFDRHNRYSDWEAALREDGRLTDLAGQERGLRRLLKGILIRMPVRPLIVFLHAYVLMLGFLDGRAGLHHAMARAFYHWQIDVKRLACRHSVEDPPSFSPPRAFTRSNVRLRTDGSEMR